MILKEWKEKFGLFLFALAGFLFFGLAFSAYSQDKEALDLLMGTMTLVFVPILALLLGSSGFSSEFRDDAWAYLFSRPVKKWQIWLAKYISLLSMLVVILLVFQLVAEFHPAVKAAGQTFSIPLRFGEDISLVVLAYLLPLSLFTMAFSLSILSEKSHVVVFLAALISYSLHIGLTYGYAFLALLPSRLWLLSSLNLLTFVHPRVLLTFVSPLIPLSFAAASILTLTKGDFSQPGRRARVFAKFAAVFLAVSLGFGFIWTYSSIGLRSNPRISDIEIWSGAAYFATDSGIYRFDPATGEKNRLARSLAIWSGIAVGGGGKVAYTTFSVSGGLRAYQDLWIIDAAGKKPRALTRTSRADSPLLGAYIYAVAMSSGGDKVAFITRDLTNADAITLWSVNADGTGLKGYSPRWRRSLNLRKGMSCRILGFADSSRSILISPAPLGKIFWEEGAKLLKVNVESGVVEVLAEHIHGPQLRPGEEGGREPALIAYIKDDRVRSLSTLTLLDAATLEKRDVYEAASIGGFRWNPAGDKLAFVTGKTKIGIYSVAENRLLELKEVAGYDLRWPSASLDWALEDGVILRKLDKGVSSLSLLDGSLREQKTLQLPFSTRYSAQVLGGGRYAFVVNSEKHELWSVDLNTDKWSRIY
ncbi:MAG: hypothetical protein A2W03_11735 [Candidatus Aminicenantes bacterium RBG_16_63_16]|nr:MAG: hypothetical protein A2W03_11735 [Candidatus Aminicenantes bacterium RBG_16_63_16]